MIEPVESLCFDLERLLFDDMERLEEREIRVKVGLAMVVGLSLIHIFPRRLLRMMIGDSHTLSC